jgi:hypothetical protein
MFDFLVEEVLTFNTLSVIFWIGAVVYIVISFKGRSVEEVMSKDAKNFFKMIALASTIAEVIGLILVAIGRDMALGSAIPRFIIVGLIEMGMTLMFGTVIMQTILSVYMDGVFEFKKEIIKVVTGVVLSIIFFIAGFLCTKMISILYYESIGAISVRVVLENIVSMEIPFVVQAAPAEALQSTPELSALILIYATPLFNVFLVCFVGIDLWKIYILNQDPFKVLNIPRNTTMVDVTSSSNPKPSPKPAPKPDQESNINLEEEEEDDEEYTDVEDQVEEIFGGSGGN